MPLYWSVAWCTEATRGSSPLFTLCGCSLLSAVSTTAFICAHAYTATDAATRPATTRRSTARITSKEGTSSSSAPGTTAQRGRHSPPGQVRVPPLCPHVPNSTLRRAPAARWGHHRRERARVARRGREQGDRDVLPLPRRPLLARAPPTPRGARRQGQAGGGCQVRAAALLCTM